MAKGQATDQARLKIGAVAKMTGLSAHNLRKWEERYGAVKPHRTGSGERLYNREDVRRLLLIKKLSKAGVPIGEVAKATLADLERISQETVSEQSSAATLSHEPASIRVVIIGNVPMVPGDMSGAEEPGIDVFLRSDDVVSAEQRLAGQSVDIVVLECPTVHDRTEQLVADAMHTLGARRALVVYGFGARAALEALRRTGVVTTRAPVDSGEFRRAIVALMQGLTGAEPGSDARGGETVSDAPPPRFSPDSVARIISMSPSIKCECPHHLAQIVMSLSAFEQYSTECETSSPNDAELHRYLKRVAGRSRAAFEEALARVAEAEGIFFDD